MLDLRQLETLAPSPQGCSQDVLAMTPCGPGKHGQQAPETSRAVQVSSFLPVPSRPPDSLSQLCANSGRLSTGPAVLALPLWHVGILSCKVRVELARLCIW